MSGTATCGLSSGPGRWCGLALGFLVAACGATAENPVVDRDGGVPEGSAEPAGEGLPVPFVVDNFFYPSGCYGSEEGCPFDISGADACESRAMGAQGECYQFSIPTEVIWAGLFFQNLQPDGDPNWGGAEGVAIAQGAKRVTFRASSDPPGQAVRFKVGGIGVDDAQAKFHDTLDLERTYVLGAEPTPYEISLEGQTYSHVISAFGWFVERLPNQTAPIQFFVDDVRWE